ncbi:hypothetical protein GCM10027452_01840 [Micromonospora halotolerans]
MVVDADQQLALPAAGQQHPADQIHLPQLHRRLTRPPFVLTVVALLLRNHHVPWGSCRYRGELQRASTGLVDLGVGKGFVSGATRTVAPPPMTIAKILRLTQV